MSLEKGLWQYVLKEAMYYVRECFIGGHVLQEYESHGHDLK